MPRPALPELRTAVVLAVWLVAIAGCKDRAPAAQAPATCAPDCSGRACDGCDPKLTRCDRGIATSQVGVTRWPDPVIGPNRVDAAIHRTAACGGVKWPFATTNQVCDVFSTWLADADGSELPGTRYDSTAPTVQIYGNMWSGAARACASVCGRTVCSALDR